MTKTFKELFEFLATANAYVIDGKEPKDKLAYAIKKVKKRLETAMDTWNETLADLQYDNASLDEKGNILRNKENQLVFTPAKQKELDKAARELRKKTFEFEPYYATELPKDLDEFTREPLIGFVIKEGVPFTDADSNGHEIPIGKKQEI